MLSRKRRETVNARQRWARSVSVSAAREAECDGEEEGEEERGVGVDSRETNLAWGEETGSEARVSWYMRVRVKRRNAFPRDMRMRSNDTGNVW